MNPKEEDCCKRMEALALSAKPIFFVGLCKDAKVGGLLTNCHEIPQFFFLTAFGKHKEHFVCTKFWTKIIS
jgi:hypothetical protein